MSTDWQARGKAKAESILARIPPEWRLSDIPAPEEQLDVTGAYIQQFLSASEIEITETDAVGIVAKTTTGQWKALDVAKAFCHRAALAHQLTNCLLEIFFTAGLAQAKQLDEYFKANKRPVGPLHGLPVSLKDQFHVKGVETTMGYVGWIGTFEGKSGTGKEGIFESQLTQDLVRCGAILYCKTSVPQTLMTGETENNIIGVTYNPHNRLLSPGGSSGGEGALVGLRGSPVGIGTDIAGSVRIPAASNGLYGLRPSTGRVPYEGVANSMDGQGSVLSVIGLLATSVASMEFIFKVVMAQQPWLHDPLVIEMPWRDDKETETEQLLLTGKLAFGLLLDDGGGVALHPPVRRALQSVADTLRGQGHDIVEWRPPSHTHIAELLLTIFRADGGTDVWSDLNLSGEPRIPQVGIFFDEQVRHEAAASRIAELNVEKREAQKEYLEYWNSTVAQTSTGRPVDALIAPVAPYAAPRPRGNRYYSYTMFASLLDYTSVVIPVTKVDKRVDLADATYVPKDALDKFVHESYDPELYNSAPVALQLVGRRLEEEKMLVLADYVDRTLKAVKMI